MKRKQPVILIGPYEDDPTESVSAVNRCFVDGLSGQYAFIPHVANRSFGGTRRARFNVGNALFFLKHFALWLWRVVRHRPDIVHYAINSGWALEKSLMFLRVGRVFGAKTVGHLHSGSFLDFWAGLPAGRKRRAQRQLNKLDALVVLSDAWKQRVVEHLGLPPEKVLVVNNPLDRAFEERALSMPVERTGNMLLALGVMDTQKGVLDLIEAAALARERAAFSLVIAGPEREPGIRARVERMIAEKNLGAVVQLRPGVWGEEKVELFREASVFLLPSYFENFPLVVLEAAAAGLPMIVTPVGATVEFFADGKSALFVPTGSAQPLADAIVRVCAEPDLRTRLGGAARSVFVERLARTKIMRSLDMAYAAVLKVQSAASAASPTVREVSHESPNV